LLISKVCGHANYGEKFDSKWWKSIGFVLGYGKLEPKPSPPMPKGRFSTI
jgi:hypothetical protein